MKEINAYLEITLKISDNSRANAVGVYKKYKQPFLETIRGAKSKDLLIRNKDIQVLHGFTSVDNANAYLTSDIFNNDVVKELTPLLEDTPEIRIYSIESKDI